MGVWYGLIWLGMVWCGIVIIAIFVFINRGTQRFIKYGQIRVFLTENYELQIIIQDPYLNCISIFNSHGESQITL